MEERVIENIRNSAFFKEWTEFIVLKINELNSVSGLEDFSNEQAGEEAKVRIKTVKKLKEILSPFIENPKKTGITEEMRYKAKRKAGL